MTDKLDANSPDYNTLIQQFLEQKHSFFERKQYLVLSEKDSKLELRKLGFFESRKNAKFEQVYAFLIQQNRAKDTNLEKLRQKYLTKNFKKPEKCDTFCNTIKQIATTHFSSIKTDLTTLRTWSRDYNKDALARLDQTMMKLSTQENLKETDLRSAFQSPFDSYLGDRKFMDYILDFFLTGNCKPTSHFLFLIKKITIETADKKNRPSIEGLWIGFTLDNLLKESHIEGLELPKEKCRSLKESSIYQSLLLEPQIQEKQIQDSLFKTLLLQPLGAEDKGGELAMRLLDSLERLNNPSQNPAENINTNTLEDIDISMLREIRAKLFPSGDSSTT
jgi:hypothetical protein